MIHFVYEERNMPIYIRRHLVKIYRADAVHASIWVGGCPPAKSGYRDVDDKARSGRPHPKSETHLD